MDTELETRAVLREELPKQASTLVSLIAGSIGGASQVIVSRLLYSAAAFMKMNLKMILSRSGSHCALCCASMCLAEISWRNLSSDTIKTRAQIAPRGQFKGVWLQA